MALTGVDLDEKAIATAKRNAKLNQVKARFVQAAGFHYLRPLAEQGAPLVVVAEDERLLGVVDERLLADPMVGPLVKPLSRM